MKRRADVPGNELGKTLGQMRQPKAEIPVARTIPNDEHPAGRDPRKKPFEETRLFVRPKVVEEIEEGEIATLLERIAGILLQKLKLAVAGAGDRLRAGDLPFVAIEPNYARLEVSFAKIKPEQSDTAADIDHCFVRILQQSESRRKNGIAPQFPSHIETQPKLAETRRHPGTGALMFGGGSIPVYHCVALSR